MNETFAVLILLEHCFEFLTRFRVLFPDFSKMSIQFRVEKRASFVDSNFLCLFRFSHSWGEPF